MCSQHRIRSFLYLTDKKTVYGTFDFRTREIHVTLTSLDNQVSMASTIINNCFVPLVKPVSLKLKFAHLTQSKQVIEEEFLEITFQEDSGSQHVSRYF